MNCDKCVRINPLPECVDLDAYNPYYMEGLIFTDTDTIIQAIVTNVATKKTVYIDFLTDEDGESLIDLTTIYPVLDHVYEMRFVNLETGNPEDFTITNLDSTTSAGCCLEFEINMGQTDTNGFFVATSQTCAV